MRPPATDIGSGGRGDLGAVALFCHEQHLFLGGGLEFPGCRKTDNTAMGVQVTFVSKSGARFPRGLRPGILTLLF